jgi:hypothetical protein
VPWFSSGLSRTGPVAGVSALIYYTRLVTKRHREGNIPHICDRGFRYIYWSVHQHLANNITNSVALFRKQTKPKPGEGIYTNKECKPKIAYKLENTWTICKMEDICRVEELWQRELCRTTNGYLERTAVMWDLRFSQGSVTMKNAVSWDVTLWSSCKDRCFAGTYRLHHQCGKNE